LFDPTLAEQPFDRSWAGWQSGRFYPSCSSQLLHQLTLALVRNAHFFGHFSPADGALPVGSLATQSPAHSFVPLTVPTILHPGGPFGLTCADGLLPTFGASWAKAAEENMIAANTHKILIVTSL
jgi:hypothetical protein